MIVLTKTGVMLHGEIRTDPEVRSVGQKQVLKFDLRASSTKDSSGKWQSFFVGVNLWHGIDRLDGMFEKGDQVTVFAREIKRTDRNGRTYYDVDANDIVPGGLVQFRWMQQAIDLSAQPAPPPELAATDEATPFDQQGPAPVQTALRGAQMYPGEQLSDYAPRSAAPPAADTPEADAFINDDAADLPF